MNKQKLVRELEKIAKEKGLITKTELGRYLQMNPRNTERFTKGADYIPGRTKKFFISDIADNILTQKETG